jgi:integrase
MARRGDGLYLRGEVWYLGCSINGTRYQKRLGRGITRSVARNLAQVLRAAILKGEAGIGTKRKDLSFDEARKRFEDWATTNKRPRTTRQYQKCLHTLASSFSGKRLSQISSFHVEAHKARRVKARVAANRELSVLGSLFNRCREWKLFEGENPVKTVKMRPEPRQRLRFLEHEEEDRLLAACGEPLRTLIVIGIYCGLRLASEALTLTWADVDLVRKTVTVLAAFSKNGRTRTVPLHSRVVAALAALSRRGEFVFVKSNGAPYTSVRNGFGAACRRAGLTGVTPHTLRHTFATRLIENGTDLRMVQELGGWSSLGLLQRYGHVSPVRKADAIEKGFVRNSTTLTTTAEIRQIGQTA